jgi:hypothetical protein
MSSYALESAPGGDLLEAGRGIISRQLAEQQSILRDLETS